MTGRSGDSRGFLRRNARRILVIVGGSAVVLAGAALLVLPGPGTVVIVAGLAILASEFDWADRWMRRVKQHAEAAAKRTGVSVTTLVVGGLLLAAAISVGAWFLFR